MATGLVIHISSGKDKHTQVLTDEHVRIGSSDDCSVRLRAASLPARAGGDEVVLELERRNGSYVVTDFDTSLEFKLNGKPLESTAQIEDGDEVRFGDPETRLERTRLVTPTIHPVQVTNVEPP